MFYWYMFLFQPDTIISGISGNKHIDNHGSVRHLLMILTNFNSTKYTKKMFSLNLLTKIHDNQIKHLNKLK